MKEVEVAVVVTVSGAGVTVMVFVEVETGNVMDNISVTPAKVEVTVTIGAGAVKTEVDVEATRVVVAEMTMAGKVTSDVSVKVFAGAVLVQGAVASVTVIRLVGPSEVLVMAKSLMPTTLEQKAEALAATSRRTASSTSTLRSRLETPGAACTLPRGVRSRKMVDKRNMMESVWVKSQGRDADFRRFISPILSKPSTN